MKRLLFISFALLVLGGCGSSGLESSRRLDNVAAGSGSKIYWDKDLRPVVLPTRAERPAEPQQRPPEAPGEAEPKTEPVEVAVAPVPAASETELVVPAFRSPGTVRPGLVAVSEAGMQRLVMVYPRPDYGIIQVDKIMPNEVRLNKPFEYVIGVTNLTEGMLADLTITETLPTDFSFKGSEPTAIVDGDKLIWEMNSLGPKASKQIRVLGVPTQPVSLEHCTALTHTMRACSGVKVVQPVLEILKVAPTEALICEPIQAEFIITNSGTGAAQNVQIVDALPDGLQTVDGRAKVVLDAGTLAAGESRQFSVKLRATKTGVYVNKAVATSASGLKAESDATLTTVRQPLLALAKKGPKMQYLGRVVSYEITVTNKGDGPAMNTVIEDVLPPGVTSTEATTGAKLSGSKLIWEVGTLEPGASEKVRISYEPSAVGELLSTASATAYCAETVTASAKTTIKGIAAIRLEVVDLEDPVEVGGHTTYLIMVTNQGSAPDSNVRVVCGLDDRLRHVSSSGATAGSIMGKTVSFAPLRTLEPKAKATWRVVVRGVRAGDARFKVVMNSDELGLPVGETEATFVYEQNNR